MSLWQKYLAGTVITAANIFFIYYVLLKAYQRGSVWQMQFISACIVQCFFEVFFNATTECLWLNFMMPNLIADDVKDIKATIETQLNSLFTDTDMRKRHHFLLNAPSHLFVSHHLATGTWIHVFIWIKSL